MDQRQDSRRSRTVQVAGYGKKKLSKFEVRFCNCIYEATFNKLQADSSGASNILALLGIVLQGSDIGVGLTCSPEKSCKTNPVCCKDTIFNGLIALGCSPTSGNS
ncbi:hypothetical protein CPB83DRAFT_831792 [Crepidotus variabilis]|uniref:Hydrophobin n=1 Tax=Crepidotus variabilis TaxID=179855 RepID=A0A9P6JW02_9AGAR|nr:hypothetical protein CPB83DRAFT_831792 [Crepidotus variabilis]